VARLIQKAEDQQTAALLEFPGAVVRSERVLPTGYAEDWAHAAHFTDDLFGRPQEVLAHVRHAVSGE
jgi:hypothetical protein